MATILVLATALCIGGLGLDYYHYKMVNEVLIILYVFFIFVFITLLSIF